MLMIQIGTDDLRDLIEDLDPDKLTILPMELFDEAIEDLDAELKAKPRKIKSKRVKRSTFEWREKVYERHGVVETYEGSYRHVVPPSYKAGMRTETLLGDIENIRKPGVIKILDRDLDGITLSYEIGSDAFARSYPIFFHEWLIAKSNMEEGLLFHEADVESALFRLGTNVADFVEKKLIYKRSVGA